MTTLRPWSTLQSLARLRLPVAALMLWVALAASAIAQVAPLTGSAQAPAISLYAPNTDEQAAISQTNLRRAQIGLPALNYNANLEQSSRAHANYLAINNATGHGENSGLPGFTGAFVGDRITATAYGAPWSAGEVISFGSPTGSTAIESLIQAIYHRYGLFSTAVNEIGVGFVTNHPSFGAVTVVNTASQSAVPPMPFEWVGVYPYPGQTEVTRNFYPATESPNPVPEAGSGATGYPISLHVGGGRVLAVASFTIAPSATPAATLPVKLLSAATDANTPNSIASIIPLSPLAYGTEYQVTFNGSVDSTPFTRTWTFTTAALLPITFSPAQPYLGYNSSIDITISGGSGSYSAGWSYIPPAPADLAFIGSNVIRVTSPAVATGSAVTGNINLTVTDDEGHEGTVVIHVQPTVDAIPDAFGFTAVTGAAPSAIVQSNAVTVTGIDVPTAISIAGGEYSINGGAFTNQSGSVVNGDTVRVRLTSASTAGTTTTATLTIGGVSGTFSVTTAVPDTIPPSVPTGLGTNNVTSSQITVNWTASIDNVGVTGYQVYRGGTFRATVTAPAVNFIDTGLTGSTSYTYTVAACDAAGNCSAQSATVSATTDSPCFCPDLELGWNLKGNALDTTIDVSATFGNATTPVSGVSENIFSMWKWDAANQKWQFYSPQLTPAQMASFAASKGYDVLATVGAGEGYWVNATTPIGLPQQTGTNVTWSWSQFSALPSAWNLIATSSGVSPSQFNANVSLTPPAPGTVPTDNFLSLWAWDAAQAKWFFYSPLLESTVGLDGVKAYADGHFYLHFQDYSKILGVGTGFWVNKP